MTGLQPVFEIFLRARNRNRDCCAIHATGNRGPHATGCGSVRLPVFGWSGNRTLKHYMQHIRTPTCPHARDCHPHSSVSVSFFFLSFCLYTHLSANTCLHVTHLHAHIHHLPIRIHHPHPRFIFRGVFFFFSAFFLLFFSHLCPHTNTFACNATTCSCAR